MKIAFRSDASMQIGTGHVMRCLTLADEVRKRGAQCTFICRESPGHLLDFIRQRGHDAIALRPADSDVKAPARPPHAHWLGTDLATDAEQTRHALGAQVMDWLVVDHYALDFRWEQALRPHARQIMVIDDLADRRHDCDLLLDQNLGRAAKDYVGLLNPSTEILIGPQYALLRPEFAKWREYSLARRAQPQLKNLLITMGGVDQGNATGQVLDALKNCALPADLEITAVMGPHAPWLAQVQAQAAAMPWPTQVLAGVSNMAQLMAESDLAIGAAGSTSWERCCLGLPTILVVLADNQRLIATALANSGAAVTADVGYLGLQLPQQPSLNGDAISLRAMSDAARNVCNGRGVSSLVSLISKDVHEHHAIVQ